MDNIFSLTDLILAPVFFVVFFIIAREITSQKIENEPYYKYFVSGLFVKLLGGIGVCLIYVYYYSGGDTVAYYLDNSVVVRLFLKDPSSAFTYMFSKMDAQMYSHFDTNTGWLIFGTQDHASYVTKVTWLLSLISFNSFIGQTMLLAFLSYLTTWRLYKVFVNEFPDLQKGMAFAFLFIPSVVFWGSGLLKDTITLAGVSLFTSSFYRIIKLKRGYFINSILMLIGSWLMIKIKPYIFFALLPGTMIWFAAYQMEKFRNQVVRSALTPAFLGIAVFLGFLFLQNMGDSLGDYAFDKVLDKAVITQQDLKRDAYQAATFDIGEFEPTIPGILSKAPVAIVAALFRPFLWESYSPSMIVSGLENFILLIFTIYLLARLRIINFFRLLRKNHLLLFSVSFSIFFAFSVGLTSSNFGSLVRYKIPAIPFFVASLLIANYYYQQKKEEGRRKEQEMFLK